ncbi:MAG: class I SAM-dependent methyltransferase [Alphaproteobacteria bacterium]|nr:class I SAM-dependent methyltransferase [Alphaproteobacteria bacterium]
MFSNLTDRLHWLYRRFRVGASFHRNDALGALHRAWGYVHATFLIGDYYEFGVYRGTSLLNSWLSCGHFRRNLEAGMGLRFRREGNVGAFLDRHPVFHAFDTFSGMPDNDEGEANLVRGSYFGGKEDLVARAALVGLRPPDLRVVEGLFRDSAKTLSGPAAVVHIDCDLHASARDALDVIEPCLRQGTVVLFDDFNLFRADDLKGERRALKEFQERTGVVFEPWFAYGPAAQSFLVHTDRS